MEQTQNWYEKPEMPGKRQFLILILLFVGGCVLTGAIGVFIMLARDFQKIDMENISSTLADCLALVQNICIFGIPAIMFASIIKKRKDYFYFHQKSVSQLWLLAIVMAVAAMFVSDLLGQLTEYIPLPKSIAAYFKEMENTYDKGAAAVLNFKTFGAFLASLATIALLPAVFEELFFRGALQQALLKWTKQPTAAIIITAIIFSAFHFSYYGFLARASLGVVLGYVYYYGKNIWLNMLIHFINNATIVTILYIENGSKPLSANLLYDNSSMSPWYLQIIGVIVLIAAVKIFIKKAVTIDNCKLTIDKS